jgi:hypothetical protein
MNSDLYGVYSIVGRAGSASSDLHVWYRVGNKRPVTNYRLLIPGYGMKTGKEQMHAEDSIGSLFNRNEMKWLLEYLTRHELFGDTHTFVRAENSHLRQLRQYANKQGKSGFDLISYDDWHHPFEVYSCQLTHADWAIGLN